MLRESLIVTFGFLGLLIAGTVVGTAPASAGYTCGPWNAWCGRAFWAYPGWGYGWYGGHHRHYHWRRSYGHGDWDNDWHKGKGKHAYKHKHWKDYD